MTIVLTESQVNNLVQLLDVAVKAGGLRNAEAALEITQALRISQMPESAPQVADDLTEIEPAKEA